MGLYKLKKGAGTHQEVINGIVCDFVGGDTINTSTELDKSFPGKFQRLDVEEMKTYRQPSIPIPARFIKSDSVTTDSVDVTKFADEVLIELVNEVNKELEKRDVLLKPDADADADAVTEIPEKFKKSDELPRLKNKSTKDK